jgi:uncharacterized membrane protein (UPF0127 family)
MKKEAWPWIGSTEHEMGSMSPRGDFRDISNDAYEGYDMLSPVKYNHENMVAETGTEGMRNIVDQNFSDMQDEEASALKDMVKCLRDMLEEDMTVAAIGDLGAKFSKAFEDKRVNILGLYKDSIDTSSSLNIYKDSGNPMFYKFQNRVNGFVLDLTNTAEEDSYLTLKNLSDQVAFDGTGIVLASPDLLVEDLIEKSGFKILSKHLGRHNKLLVKSSRSSKVAIARYYGHSSKEQASFLCDLADTFEKKVDGLQVYSKLKEQCGLIFPYERPTDVMFHMGSVSYPIDIIFIDDASNIKKICKNIQPGSIEVFGSHGISNVLEIAGGLSDLLNIEVGGKLYITRGETYSGDIKKAGTLLSDMHIDGVAFKRSFKLGSSAYSVSGKNIIRIKEGEAPPVDNLIRKFASKINFADKKSKAVDIDSFINSMQDIRLYKSSPPSVDKRVYRGLFNETFSIKRDAYIDVPASAFFKKGAYKRLNKTYSLINDDAISKSLTRDHIKVLGAIGSTPSSEIIIVSREDMDKELLETFLENIIRKTSNQGVSFDTRLLRIPKRFGSKGAYKAAEERFGDIDLYACSLIKEGGMPVPDGTKAKAREALKSLGRASDLCSKLIDNFSQNLEAYNKISDNLDAISSSKGKYNQSCKRNSRVAKRMLLNIKSSIQILNEIKDVATTSEVISSIAEAAKVSSESVKSIIDLVNTIDTEGFLEKLTESSQKCESSLEDTILALDRARDYINADILGILVLTE